ncbi:MAG: DUF2059 domain-containing protein [Proteobacteria bacterium]|nr:DUF2059 domain-containing protein [Pseudomonadota bacterium]
MMGKFTTRTALVLTFFSAAFATPVYAQQPSARAVAYAQELIQLKEGLAMFAPLIPGVIENSKLVFLQQNPALTKDLDAVAEKLRKDFDPRRNDLAATIARAYASNFTEAELKDLVAFYKTPLGKKLLVGEPKALEQALQAAQTFGDDLSTEVMEKMRAEMKKKGHSL